MDATTRRLVEFALDTRYEDLAARTVLQAKRRLLDTLGCAMAAFDLGPAVIARRQAARYRFDAPATIWGTHIRVAPEMAAFANGVALRLLDLNDMYRVKSGGHPSDIQAALVATAESAGADGRALIAALVVGYEVYCGCCNACDLNSAGWDQPIYGVVAATLACGKLMGLSPEQLGHAVALGLVPHLATYATRHGELSSWKGCAAANASRHAVFATMLAQAGITGPAQPFDGKAGLYEMVGRFDWAGALNRPPHLLAETHLKAFPLCYHGQSAVEAAFDLRTKARLGEIEEIRIETYAVARSIMADDPSRWAPDTRESADHSLPYVVAVALADGAVDQASFVAERHADPVLKRLMAMTQVQETGEMNALHPEASPCRIVARLADGREVASFVRYPKGHTQYPLGPDEVTAKFRNLMGPRAREGRAERIVVLVDGLDALCDLGELMDALADGEQERKQG